MTVQRFRDHPRGGDRARCPFPSLSPLRTRNTIVPTPSVLHPCLCPFPDWRRHPSSSLTPRLSTNTTARVLGTLGGVWARRTRGRALALDRWEGGGAAQRRRVWRRGWGLLWPRYAALRFSEARGYTGGLETQNLQFVPTVCGRFGESCGMCSWEREMSKRSYSVCGVGPLRMLGCASIPDIPVPGATKEYVNRLNHTRTGARLGYRHTQTMRPVDYRSMCR